MVGRTTPGAKQTLELLQTKLRVSTLARAGALAACVDTRLYDLAMQEEGFPRGIEGVRVEGAGHFLQQERPGEIHRIRVDRGRGIGRKALR